MSLIKVKSSSIDGALGSMNLIATHSASNEAVVEITSTNSFVMDSTYKRYVLQYTNVHVSGDGTTMYGKLYVEGKKEDKETTSEYLHKGLAQRSFTRVWTISDDTEVRSVSFKDGLLIVDLGKIVPEHHARKDFL